jgi:hypothetical protein
MTFVLTSAVLNADLSPKEFISHEQESIEPRWRLGFLSFLSCPSHLSPLPTGERRKFPLTNGVRVKGDIL